MIGALVTQGLGFAAQYLITRGLEIGEAAAVTLRIFGPAPSGAGRHFGTAPTSGTVQLFDDAPAAGTRRIFKQ